MATRTFKTGDDVDAALNFLGRKSIPPKSGDQYLEEKFQELVESVLKTADDNRFSLVKEMMDDKNKGGSIKKLRELLGV